MGRIAAGGRRYVREFVGRAGGRARYIKEVDVNERTVRFAQEIYDASARLVTVHEKFPRRFGSQTPVRFVTNEDHPPDRCT